MMTTSELSGLIQEAVLICKLAGTAIMDVYGHEDFQIEIKQDESPLTIADKKSNSIICEHLQRISPDIPIISEENKQLDFDQRKHFEYAWMVDPLDGTKEFIKRNGEFTINIALVHNHKSIGGVVYLPVSQTAFSAVKDNGAFKQSNGSTDEISVRSFQRDAKDLEIVCSRSHLNDITKAYIEQYNRPQLLPKGSALKFTVLAEGKADLYPRLGPTMEWDTAAAQIILEEAGGAMLEWNTREPMVYNKEDLLNPNFIAFGKGEVF